MTRSAGHHRNTGGIVYSPEWRIMQNLKWKCRKRINKRSSTFSEKK